MEIYYIASKLSRAIRQNNLEPIDNIVCVPKEFKELWDEAKESGLVNRSDDHWFTLESVNFLIHLDNTLE